MKRKVVAIGIDGPNPEQFKAWCEGGLLPNISKIADLGVTGSYTHVKKYRNEQCWNTFLSGRDTAGCGSSFNSDTYDFYNVSLQREERYTPFYALGAGYKVCMFDVPGPLSPLTNGIQVTGWGSELNASRPMSLPVGLMSELESKYGMDPKLDRSLKITDYETGETERSYSVPSIYDNQALNAFKSRLLTAISRRTDICLDLLSRDDWDLFLSVFTETHTANHSLWHFTETYPVNPVPPVAGDALLEIFQAVDQGIGRITRALSPDVHVLVYTIDHTKKNTMDVPSMALLPELIFRWNFPDCQALASGDVSEPVPPVRYDYKQHWKQEVWALRTEMGDTCLVSPEQRQGEGDPLGWNPANWYKPLWSGMRAFALPSVSDGYIRLNVTGRESRGMVPTEEYQRVLQELCESLEGAINPRSGRPAVKKLIRTRHSPEESPQIPPDLIVCWDDEHPLDTLDSPGLGRVGPVPYFRSGGHVAHGTHVTNTLVACGPGITPGTITRTGALEDLPATILHLLGAEFPDQQATGSSLLDANHLS